MGDAMHAERTAPSESGGGFLIEPSDIHLPGRKQDAQAPPCKVPVKRSRVKCWIGALFALSYDQVAQPRLDGWGEACGDTSTEQ
eukprot:6489021-Amphidinium_carterae.3